MARTRRSAKQAGSRTERAVADYLAKVLNDDRIDRRVKAGSKDRGDIAGWRHMLARITVEVKDYGGRLLPAEWIKQAQIERANADDNSCLVIAKRRGTTHPGDWWVLTTLDELLAMQLGSRDHLNEPETSEHKGE